MLEVLETLNRDEAAQALAATTHALSPDPQVNQPESSPAVSPDLIRRVVNDLRRHLHLQANDNSPRAQAKMFTLLSKIISQQFLAQNQEEVRRRLGRRGDLAPSDYSIVLEEAVADMFEDFGSRKKLIMEVLQRPHKVEHLLADKVEAGDAPAVSLYLRHVGIPDARDSYFFLVQTTRRNDVQEVIGAFQIFQTEVNAAVDASPLQVLKAFVDVYGLRFCIGPVQSEKFVLHETRPLALEKFRSDFDQLIQVETPNDERYMIFGLFRESGLGVLEVAVAYAVNLNAYAAALKSHGVKVTWQGQQFKSRLVRYDLR